MLQDRADALSHLLGRLSLEGFDIDNASAQLLVRGELLEAVDVLKAAIGELEYDLGRADLTQGREDVAVVAHRAEWAPVEIAEADVHRKLRVHAFDGAVDAPRHVLH